MLRLAVIVIILSAQTNEPSEERFWENCAYVPSSINEIVGVWSFNGGFGGSTVEFSKNRTFIESSYSDVMTRESQFVESLRGTYRWEEDTLTMAYTGFVPKSSAQDSDITSIVATMDDQMEWRTFLEGRCYIRRVNNRLLLIRLAQKRFFSYWSCKNGGKPPTGSVLMKTEE